MSQEIVELLQSHDLPTNEDAVEDVRHALKTASDTSREIDSTPVLKKDDAGPLMRAADKVLRGAEHFKLANNDDLDVVRLIRAKAQLATFIKHPPGERPRHWLGPCAYNFLMSWRLLAPHKSEAVYEGSVALAFVTECCQFIDASVTESAVLLPRTHCPSRGRERKWRACAAIGSALAIN